MKDLKRLDKVVFGIRFIVFTTMVIVLTYAITVLAEGETKVTVCHHPGPNEVTIRVAEPALGPHLAHGDYLGECEETYNTCPFEPITLELTSPDPVQIPVQITTTGQDINFSADDPPGVAWYLTDNDGNILLNPGGYDDHVHLIWYGFSEPGKYQMVFQSDLAGTTYPSITVILACDYEAPPP
jgi:hypothetical protein